MRRFRSALTVAASAAALVTIVATPALATTASPAVAAPPTADSPPAASRASTATIDPADLVVDGYDILGPLDQQPGLVRDNGQSVLYQGRSYWYFDDTIFDGGFLSSTASVTSDLDASDNIHLVSADPFDESDSGTPRNFVPYSADETAFEGAHAANDCVGSSDQYCGTRFAFWPGATVADPARHRMLVFYGKLCRGGPDDGPCASGFVGQAIGSGIVAVDPDRRTVERLSIDHRDPALSSPEGSDPTLLFSPAESWGSGGAVVVGDELYGYGRCTSSNDCAVGRVPLDRVTDRAAWTFYTGDVAGTPQWSTDPAAAVLVMKGGSAGETVHYDPTTGQYMNTYLPALSDQVSFQTAPDPWGPWSTPRPLFAAASTSGVEYAAFAHPEYTSADGLTRYFTYYTSSTGQQMLVRVRFRIA